MGDSGVGKTCLLVRFKDGAFLAGTFISTVGIDFRVRVEADVPSSDWVQLGYVLRSRGWSLATIPAASQHLRGLGKPPNTQP